MNLERTNAATGETAAGGASDAVRHRPRQLPRWPLDAFDSFVVVFALPAIAQEFGTDIKAVALTITVTLAFRPVGAFIFGLMADRSGRRLPLMIDLVFHSVIEVLSGFAPCYTSFPILRALFGIGMGHRRVAGHGKSTRAVARCVVRPAGGRLRRRLFARRMLLLLRLPHLGLAADVLDRRLARSARLFIRLGVKESAVWEKTRHESWRHLRRAILAQWRLFLYLTALMTMMIFLSHGTQDMYPTFLKLERGFEPKEVAKNVRRTHLLRQRHGSHGSHHVHHRRDRGGARARAPQRPLRRLRRVAASRLAI